MLIKAYRRFMTSSGPLIEYVLRRRQEKGKEDPARAPERRGTASRPRPDGPLIWIHAASVGESLSVLCLIERIGVEYPGINLMVTTGTVTSARLMEERLPDGAIHQFIPVDRAEWVEKFLGYWRPGLALWVESELWPTLLTSIRDRQIPLILLNARISPRSYRNWGRFQVTIRELLSCFDLCLAQTDADKVRLDTLGAPNVKMPGNLKFAAPPLPCDAGALETLQSAVSGRVLWLASSTHPGENEIVLEAHAALKKRFPNLLTIIAPRHPARGPEIAAAANRMGLNALSRSDKAAPAAETEIYIADTVGELGLFYRLVPVSFVGGSLIPHGGQNILEAAKLGSAILHGPHMTNFQVIADAMKKAGGTIEVSGAESLAEGVGRLLGQDDTRRAQTDAAAAVAEDQSGVLDRVMGEITPWLDRAKGRQDDAGA